MAMHQEDVNSFLLSGACRGSEQYHQYGGELCTEGPPLPCMIYDSQGDLFILIIHRDPYFTWALKVVCRIISHVWFRYMYCSGWQLPVNIMLSIRPGWLMAIPETLLFASVMYISKAWYHTQYNTDIK